MRLTVQWNARPFERFAPGAFKIGAAIPVRLDNDSVIGGRLVKTATAEDGSSVDLTIEIPDGSVVVDAGPYSLLDQGQTS